MANRNLHKAKRKKNDEFYTMLTDIEKELKHYKKHFKGKIVFCNCDDPEKSNFWKYFFLNFEFFGLKKLIATHYEKDKPSYMLSTTDGFNIVKLRLKQNGDFRSPECVELLEGCDIVVTNPPFSLFREYLSQLVGYGKKFIIVGNMNAITYKETFNLIKGNKIWLGNNGVSRFLQPDGTVKKFGNVCWYTNMSHLKRNEAIILYKKYSYADYPTYDNYDAINVGKTKEIPMDYLGVMGVPISFMTRYNPEQFEILGSTDRGGDDFIEIAKIRLTEKKEDSAKIKGKKVYKRIFIRNKRIGESD